jgi:hypothetical protein
MSTIKLGRKSKSVHRAAAEAIIAESAPQAAGRIRDYALGKLSLTTAQLDACKYLVDQAIGRATQRQEISGSGGPLEIIVRWDGNGTSTDEGTTPETSGDLDPEVESTGDGEQVRGNVDISTADE